LLAPLRTQRIACIFSGYNDRNTPCAETVAEFLCQTQACRFVGGNCHGSHAWMPSSACAAGIPMPMKG
jgi:hypothetical protein